MAGSSLAAPLPSQSSGGVGWLKPLLAHAVVKNLHGGLTDTVSGLYAGTCFSHGQGTQQHGLRNVWQRDVAKHGRQIAFEVEVVGISPDCRAAVSLAVVPGFGNLIERVFLGRLQLVLSNLFGLRRVDAFSGFIFASWCLFSAATKLTSGYCPKVSVHRLSAKR